MSRGDEFRSAADDALRAFQAAREELSARRDELIAEAARLREEADGMERLAGELTAALGNIDEGEKKPESPADLPAPQRTVRPRRKPATRKTVKEEPSLTQASILPVGADEEGGLFGLGGDEKPSTDINDIQF